jgi:capsular polysaccharide export protein
VARLPDAQKCIAAYEGAMKRSVLITTPILRRRAEDVEAALGAVESPMSATAKADYVACWGPLTDDKHAEDLAKRGKLVRFSPAPFGFERLDASARPLGYRLQDPPRGTNEGKLRQRAEGVLARLESLRGSPGAMALGMDLRFPAPAAGRDPVDAIAETMIAGSVWFDPYDRRRVEIEEAIDFAEELVGYWSRDPRPSVGLNITVGKRRHVRAFLDSPAGPVSHHTLLEPALEEAKARNARIVVWASKGHERIEAACAEQGIALARMEDGFLRSVGLGAAFVKSLSLVVDERGIYYDPSRPSDLEHILQTADIDQRQIARAAELRKAVVASSLTKYNVGRSAGPALVPAGRTGVLVPGQVEDDASILRGASSVRTNLGLLQAARARRPDAFLIYKPHPDVEAGYRTGKIEDAEALRVADAVVRDRSIASLFAECRAIETITSLSGFEGLLRGLEVTTHGAPFYSGWGLTTDLAPLDRRTRKRSLDELVAAALILYPRYVDPISELPCGPEVILRRLAAEMAIINAGERPFRRRLLHGAALVRHRVLGRLLRMLP